MRYGEPSLGGVLTLTSSHTDYWGLLPPLFYFLSQNVFGIFFLCLEERDGVFWKKQSEEEPRDSPGEGMRDNGEEKDSL